MTARHLDVKTRLQGEDGCAGGDGDVAPLHGPPFSDPWSGVRSARRKFCAAATSSSGWRRRAEQLGLRLKILATQIGFGAPAGVEPATSPAIGSVCETRSYIRNQSARSIELRRAPFLPVLKCDEKWLIGSFHGFRSETNAKGEARPSPCWDKYRPIISGAVPTIDLPDDELAAVAAAIRRVKPWCSDSSAAAEKGSSPFDLRECRRSFRSPLRESLCP